MLTEGVRMAFLALCKTHNPKKVALTNRMRELQLHKRSSHRSKTTGKMSPQFPCQIYS